MFSWGWSDDNGLVPLAWFSAQLGCHVASLRPAPVSDLSWETQQANTYMIDSISVWTDLADQAWVWVILLIMAQAACLETEAIVLCLKLSRAHITTDVLRETGGIAGWCTKIIVGYRSVLLSVF